MRGVRSIEERASKPQSGYKIPKALFASLVLVLDAVLVTFIISYVPYTKIDWDAYMSQVDGFLAGERDYTKLKGDTGPLVYPAGFLYVYSLIKFITGGQVFPAQILFGILYIVNLGIILFIYLKTEVVWEQSKEIKKMTSNFILLCNMFCYNPFEYNVPFFSFD